jgi:ABC-type Fe3+-siderophore transport system permease subunit
MKNIKALSISLMTSVGIITLFTIIEGSSAPFSDILESLTGNLWIIQSILGIASFAILSVILCYTVKPDNEGSAKYIWGTFSTALACTFILILFFTFHSWT